MLNILFEFTYISIVILKLFEGIFFPLYDPEKIICKELKYSRKSLSTVERRIYDRSKRDVFTSWYTQIRSSAIEISGIAKDCHITTFSDGDNQRFILPDMIQSYNQSSASSKVISVYPCQTNIKITRRELLKIDVKAFIFEYSIQALANLYDSSILWGDGDKKACGILNKDDVLAYSVVRCLQCDDVDDPELKDAVMKMMTSVSYLYQDNLKWYVHPNLTRKLVEAISTDGLSWDSPKLFGRDIVEAKVMPTSIRHPYPLMLANLPNAYYFVDKTDEFNISRKRDGNNVNLILRCEIGGQFLKPQALVLLNTLQVQK